MSLKEQLAEYRAGWFKRVPADRQAIMERHIAQLRNGLAKAALKPGDQAPAIVTFYRGGWCPYCNLQLRAFQQILPDLKAAGASLVAVSPEKPDDTLSTAEKNALAFEVLSDVGQKVGRAFGLVYQFSDELKSAYQGFGIDIPAKNAADEWALPLSATYVIGRDGIIIYAYTDADYRDRADPMDVLAILKQRAAA
jgi:peroxiredoxin